MKTTAASARLALLLCLGGPLSAVGLAAQQVRVEIKFGFLKGNDYLNDLSERERGAYVMGVYDGLLGAALFGTPKRRLAWLEACGVGMGTEQVAAIVDKYLRDNPARWNEGMNVLVYSAMLGACQAYRK